MLRNDVEVSIVLSTEACIDDENLRDFSTVYRLPIRPLRRNIKDVLLYLPFLLVAAIKLRFLLWRAGADALLLNDFYLMHGALVKLLGYRGAIITWVRIDPAVFGRIGHFWLWATKLASDQVVAVSQYIHSLLPQTLNRTVVYDAVTLEFLSKPPATSGEGRTFIYLGNYIPGKGQDLAIEALAEVVRIFPDARIEFHGGDMGLEKNRAYRRSLEQRTIELGLQASVSFFDFSEAPKSILVGKFAALNLSRSESFSRTVLEASACGLPVVATRCGGPEEIIVDGITGFLVPVGDVASCASAMISLCMTPELAARMGVAGRKRVMENFSPARFHARLKSLLSQLMLIKRGPTPPVSQGASIHFTDGKEPKSNLCASAIKYPFISFTKYPRAGASSRYRSFQYLPFLATAGMHFSVSTLFDDVYLRQKYARGRPKVGDVLRSFAKRLCSVLRVPRATVVVIEYELLPWFPALFERWLVWRGCRLVVDYDDALFHQYDQHPSRIVRCLLGGKIATVMRLADTVVAGNDYIADYARHVGARRVEVIPTVVDLARYPAGQPDFDSSVFTIGWIGSPSTARYLHDIAPALAEVCRNGAARVRLIGSGHIELLNVPVEIMPWHEETEVDEICRFDVGIMPLPDDPWARGKCGLKLIQYMACGLPVVASPVGVNCIMVTEGLNGYLATTIDEWVKALQSLQADKDLRRRLGAAGRKRVEERYALQVTAPKLVSLLQSN